MGLRAELFERKGEILEIAAGHGGLPAPLFSPRKINIKFIRLPNRCHIYRDEYHDCRI